LSALIAELARDLERFAIALLGLLGGAAVEGDVAERGGGLGGSAAVTQLSIELVGSLRGGLGRLETAEKTQRLRGGQPGLGEQPARSDLLGALGGALGG
jgi:hypothetical protein